MLIVLLIEEIYAKSTQCLKLIWAHQFEFKQCYVSFNHHLIVSLKEGVWCLERRIQTAFPGFVTSSPILRATQSMITDGDQVHKPSQWYEMVYNPGLLNGHSMLIKVFKILHNCAAHNEPIFKILQECTAETENQPLPKLIVDCFDCLKIPFQALNVQRTCGLWKMGLFFFFFL